MYVFTPVNMKNELFTEAMNTATKNVLLCHGLLVFIYKSKAVPLQAWSGSEGSRKYRFPDFVTKAQDGGKVVSLYPQQMFLVLISVRGLVDPRAIVLSEGFYINEKFQ